MQYLAEPTAATLKGCGLQQILDKTTKTKNKTFQIMFLSEVHALFFGFTPVSVA